MLRNINDIADHYSAVFIGCGISSLYSAYRWCRRYPDKTNILLVERTGRIGGRVQTTRHGRYTTEAGAGRFSSSHTYLMELIRELGLDDRIVRLPEETHYFIDGVLLKTDADIDRHFNLRGRTISDLWHHICASVALDNGNRERAYTMTLLDYIQTIGLRDNEIRAIRCTFGYSAEFTLMNAGHAIELAGADYNIIYDRTGKKSTYYVLRGGLEQVVRELVKRLSANGATFLLNTECYQVYSNKNTCRVHLEQYPNGKVHCNTEQCVVGCPSSAFRAIRFITRETSSTLSHRTASYKRVTIPEKYMPVSYPMFRIYARYPKDRKTGRVWFDGIPKTFADTPLSKFIPINADAGIVMASYSEQRDALYWNKFSSQEEIANELKRMLSTMFPGRTIPKPRWMTVHYWNEGCHAWTKHNHGIHRWDNLLTDFESRMCGRVSWINEACSFHQAWIEGGLQLTHRWLNRMDHTIQVGGDSAITRSEVAKHNRIDDAWTIINGYVYDITKWIPNHPGGTLAIMQIVGKDGTALFMGNPIHKQKGASKILEKYRIGHVI